MIIRVDGADTRIESYLAMTDVDARLRREAEGGFFMAEGDEVIRRALQAGLTPVSTLCSERWIPRLLEMGMPEGLPMYVAETETLRAITGFRVHRGALAVFRRPATPSVAQVVTHAKTVLLLEDLVDHANVGAGFRSAAALGADCVVLSPRCADPLYRRAVKTSMGATLALPWARSMDWAGDLADLTESGFELWGLTPAPQADELDDAIRNPPSRIAVLAGTEGDGLTAATLAACSRRIRIVMDSGVDSLNVAAATAVALHALRAARKRAARA